jgi:hypothetical protein
MLLNDEIEFSTKNLMGVSPLHEKYKVGDIVSVNRRNIPGQTLKDEDTKALFDVSDIMYTVCDVLRRSATEEVRGHPYPSKGDYRTAFTWCSFLTR